MLFARDIIQCYSGCTIYLAIYPYGYFRFHRIGIYNYAKCFIFYGTYYFAVAVAAINIQELQPVIVGDHMNMATKSTGNLMTNTFTGLGLNRDGRKAIQQSC